MKTLHRAVGVFLAAVFFLSSPAQGTSFGTDQSDLYYIVSESGWGIQLVQRGSVIFATMFVYGQNGSPTWYVATMNSGDGLTWSGDLYATTGPYFATVPFNPAGVVPTKVGTMTWAPKTSATGTLTYVVNGITIVKNVTRQTLVLDDYSGTYMGALHIAVTGCSNPAGDTPPTDVPLTTISVTQSGQSVTIAIALASVPLITITGTLNQDGQFGSAVGTYTAVGNEVGNGSVSQMNVQVNSLTASYSLQSTNVGCAETGYFVGMRTTP